MAFQGRSVRLWKAILRLRLQHLMQLGLKPGAFKPVAFQDESVLRRLGSVSLAKDLIAATHNGANSLKREGHANC
jgi:hypothetical protein